MRRSDFKLTVDDILRAQFVKITAEEAAIDLPRLLDEWNSSLKRRLTSVIERKCGALSEPTTLEVLDLAKNMHIQLEDHFSDDEVVSIDLVHEHVKKHGICLSEPRVETISGKEFCEMAKENRMRYCLKTRCWVMEIAESSVQERVVLKPKIPALERFAHEINQVLNQLAIS